MNHNVWRLRPTALVVAMAFGMGGTACGGGGGEIGPLAPPTDVRLHAGYGPDDLQLDWRAPQGGADGYLVELRVGSGPFVKQNDFGSLVPGAYTGYPATLAPTAPDLIDYVVRMRTVRGSAVSEYSAEAVYHRPLNSPRSLTARFDWAAGAPSLSWVRCSTATTGVVVRRVEVDQLGIPLGDGSWTLLPVSDPAATSFVDGSATRDRRYWYQVLNVSGDAQSAPATAKPVLAGLAPPQPLYGTFNAEQQAVVFYYNNDNEDTEAIRLERQILDRSGNPVGPWEIVGEWPGIRPIVLDAVWPELATLRYRMSGIHGAYVSPPAEFKEPVNVGFYSPTDLHASSREDGTIDLTWRNRSAHALQIEVAYGSLDRMLFYGATLPPDATSYAFKGLGLGTYRLWVRAQDSWNGSVSASTIDYTTPNPPGALSLVSASVPATPASAAALLPDGGWAFLSTTPALSITASAGQFPAVERSGLVAGSQPVLAVDAQGRPHALYPETATDGGDPVLVHLFYDGSRWNSEAMVRAKIAWDFYSPALQIALDAHGNASALVVRETGATTREILFVGKVDGAWQAEAVTPPRVGSDRVAGFGLDRIGNPHFLLNGTEYARDAQGWHAGTSSMGDYVEAAVWGTDGEAAVLTFDVNGRQGVYQVGVVEKSGGAWQPRQLLSKDDGTYGARPPLHLVASADGTRIAIVCATRFGIRAFHRDGSAWRATLVGPAQGFSSTTGSNTVWAGGFLAAGFDGNGRVHFLLRDAGDQGPFTDVHEP